VLLEHYYDPKYSFSSEGIPWRSRTSSGRNRWKKRQRRSRLLPPLERRFVEFALPHGSDLREPGRAVGAKIYRLSLGRPHRMCCTLQHIRCSCPCANVDSLCQLQDETIYTYTWV